MIIINAMVSSVYAVRYAVISSGGVATKDNVFSNSEYWYDIFMAYETMLNMGIPQTNITVCYGEGTDFVSTRPEFQYRWSNERPQITQYNNHKATIQHVLDSLSHVVTGSDTFLFQWAIGHGHASENPAEYYFKIVNDDDSITRDEFAGYLNQITSYSQRIVFWATCGSGAIRYVLANNKTIVLTACEYNELHASTRHCADRTEYADFSHSVYTILNGHDNCGEVIDGDDNNDQWINISELQRNIQLQYMGLMSLQNTVCLSDMGNSASQSWWVRPPWQRCLTFSNNGLPLARIIEAGTAQLKGIEQTSPLSGLTFKKNQVALISIDNAGNLGCGSSNTFQSIWLNTPENIADGLVFKSNNNLNVMFFSPTGGVWGNGWFAPQYPPFN